MFYRNHVIEVKHRIGQPLGVRYALMREQTGDPAHQSFGGTRDARLAGRQQFVIIGGPRIQNDRQTVNTHGAAQHPDEVHGASTVGNQVLVQVLQTSGGQRRNGKTQPDTSERAPADQHPETAVDIDRGQSD